MQSANGVCLSHPSATHPAPVCIAISMSIIVSPNGNSRVIEKLLSFFPTPHTPLPQHDRTPYDHYPQYTVGILCSRRRFGFGPSRRSAHRDREVRVRNPNPNLATTERRDQSQRLNGVKSQPLQRRRGAQAPVHHVTYPSPYCLDSYPARQVKARLTVTGTGQWPGPRAREVAV